MLNRRFKHHTWYRGSKHKYTIKEVLQQLAANSNFYITKKISKEQSNDLFAETNYDTVLTDRRCTYRLTDQEKDYFLKCRDKYEKIYLELQDNWTKGFDKWDYVMEFKKELQRKYNEYLAK